MIRNNNRHYTKRVFQLHHIY